MTTDAARRAVFDTPELLENVISFLPVIDILTNVQRVSRAWNTVIKTSHTLQTKMWLRSRETHVLQPSEYYVGSIETLSGMPIYPQLIDLNPCLADVFYWTSQLEYEPADQSATRIWIHPIYCPLDLQTKAFFCNGSGQFDLETTQTWRGMQLAEPPVAVILLEVHGPSVGLSSNIRLSLQDNGGITLGHVHDVIYLASFPSYKREGLEQSALEKQGGYVRIGVTDPGVV